MTTNRFADLVVGLGLAVVSAAVVFVAVKVDEALADLDFDDDDRSWLLISPDNGYDPHDRRFV